MIFGGACPSCLAHASQNACGSLRTASSSPLLWTLAPAAKRIKRSPHRTCFIFSSSSAARKETNRVASILKRDSDKLSGNFAIFPLRWEKSARTCAFAGVSRSRRRQILRGVERSRQFSLGASTFHELKVNRAPAREYLSESAARAAR